jgi:hypothetical protein
MLKRKNSIWNNDYIVELSIKDHINELQIIDNEFKRLKNSSLRNEEDNCRTNVLKEQYDKECADLFILLATKFNYQFPVSGIVQNRQEKFKSRDQIKGF